MSSDADKNSMRSVLFSHIINEELVLKIMQQGHITSKCPVSGFRHKDAKHWDLMTLLYIKREKRTEVFHKKKTSKSQNRVHGVVACDNYKAGDRQP